MEDRADGALSPTIIWTYGLAFLGVHLAFMPLLVLLLPRRVEALAGGDAAPILSALLLTGGVVAGLANIACGALSDRWFQRFGNRRGLIGIGVGLIGLSYLGFAFAGSVTKLFAALIFFQIALNCCFAPLGAVIADHIADAHKGRMAGLSNAALPASTLLIVPLAWLFPEDDVRAFLAVGAIVAICIVPLLASWKFDQALPDKAGDHREEGPGKTSIRADFIRAWAARLLIQTGAAFVISYIYIYVAATHDPDSGWASINPSEVLAILTAPTAIFAIFATLLSGTLSDLLASRRGPLFIAAIVFASGLALLAWAPNPILFMIAYGLFQIGLAAFLSIDTALVAQLVSGNARRGALLGVMNLSNTLPAIIAPGIALMAFGVDEVAHALGVIFVVMALAAVLAGGLMLTIRSVR